MEQLWRTNNKNTNPHLFHDPKYLERSDFREQDPRNLSCIMPCTEYRKEQYFNALNVRNTPEFSITMLK